MRIPGRPAHPYIVDVCNRNGLYILMKYRLMSLPSKILNKSDYIKNASEYIEAIIKEIKPLRQ